MQTTTNNTKHHSGGEANMGRTTIVIDVVNSLDVGNAKTGLLDADQIRHEKVEFLVDTGATVISLPTDLIQRLGLVEFDKAKVMTSIGIVEKRKYSPVRIDIMRRQGDFNVIELPVGTAALLGCLPLEQLDLVVNPRLQRLEGNPAHGGEYILEQL